jgi:hypothetical protein
MLNTRRLGGEGVRFFGVVFVPQLSRAPRSGIFESIIEEERFYSSHIGHTVKGNSTESASFCVLAFEEKRVECLIF